MSYPEREFASIYNQYIDMVYRLCFSFLKNKEDTEDAVQSVFVKYWKGRKKFESEQHEKAWFIVTASNTCKDMLRQSWRNNVSMDNYDFAPDTEDSDHDDVYMAIMELPEKYKTVVYLYYYEGYKTREIAQMLRKPSSTIRNYLTAAKTDGYSYRFFKQDDNLFRAFVDSCIDGYCIVVYMERLEYENTEGIWQVTGYQVLKNGDAEIAKGKLKPYSGESAGGGISIPQEDTAIKGMEDAVLIYNVNDKKNIVSVGEEDGWLIRGILDNCSRRESVEGGCSSILSR